MSDDRFIYTGADVLGMLDDLLTDESADRWDEFHADRTRPIPFFTEAPDENLAEWLRPMRPQDEQSRRFGLDFLWALLAQRVS